MEEFEYADEQVSDREIMIAVASMIIGIGVLSLPRELANSTKFADGWIVIVIAGAIVVIITWLGARLAASFPHQSFVDYATLITTKSVAIVLTFSFVVIWLCFTAFQIRKIADISKEYFFEQTPMEVIALTFFLVVIYAVSGPTVGLLRLNMMFLPIIIFISLLIVVFNLKLSNFDNLLPMFKTSLSGYKQGISASGLSYSGFSIVLFYIALVKKPEKTAKKAAVGVLIPIGIYLFVFISSISIFGHSITKNLLYPTIELAKTVEIPGGIFERFESLFFVIWIMVIFNTTAMALDISIVAARSIFKKISKIKLIYIITPIVYFISMVPKDIMEVDTFGMYVSSIANWHSAFVIILLITIAKIRGVKRVEVKE